MLTGSGVQENIYIIKTDPGKRMCPGRGGCTLEKEKSNNKKKVVLTIVIILLLGVIAFLVWYILRPQEEEADTSDIDVFEYDTTAVALDEESLQKAVDALRAKDGTMALEMKATARSSDGQNFTCKLSNSLRNNYDMFMVIYLDETQEELYRSGLIPTGKMIDKFTTNRKLDPGEYECTIVYNQVEDDHATVHAQVNIGLTLSVQ